MDTKADKICTNKRANIGAENAKKNKYQRNTKITNKHKLSVNDN